MDLSTGHTAARATAIRLPALQASLDLLAADPGPATLGIYSGTRPDPGDPATGDLLVTISLADPPGALDSELYRIDLSVPLEGQITTTGTAVWARFFDGAGDWWADASVSDDSEGATGEIQLQTTELTEGAFARLTSAVLRG